MHEYVIKKVSDLVPYINNSRTHSEEQTIQIASSISEFGFTNPVLIDDTNNLIAGHGRLLAAKKLGLEEVPAIVLTGLSNCR
jgi:ParB-like chromosome segregation protein Spo0J